MFLGVFDEAAVEHGSDEGAGHGADDQEGRDLRVRIALLGHDVARQAREHVQHRRRQRRALAKR